MESLPDGTTLLLHKDVWTTTNMDGTRYSTNGLGQKTDLAPLRVVVETYVALHKVIRTREDMVCITETEKHCVAEHEKGIKIISAVNGAPKMWIESSDDFRSVKIENGGRTVSVDLGEDSSIMQTISDANEEVSFVFIFVSRLSSILNNIDDNNNIFDCPSAWWSNSI
jgi:hypothetical protein